MVHSWNFWTMNGCRLQINLFFEFIGFGTIYTSYEKKFTNIQLYNISVILLLIGPLTSILYVRLSEFHLIATFAKIDNIYSH